MMTRGTITVIGDDARQAMVRALLAADGYTVQDAGVADLTVLPLPTVQADGTIAGMPAEAFFDAFPPGSVVVGGRVPAKLFDLAARGGVRLHDYTTREEFAIANAVASAEGALVRILTGTDSTLQGMRVLLVGYGRISRVLARKLAALGAQVTVSARKPRDLTWITAEGFSAVRTGEIAAAAPHCDVLCNTVPAPVVTEAVLEALPADALVLDLASLPGGVDRAAAERLGRRVDHALSLPARYAPRAAAASVRDTLYQIMEETQ